MPKIVDYTPAWLSQPCPGFKVFNKQRGPQRANGDKTDDYSGPNRTIAHRGAEVFVVVGNQLRWTDLSLLKERWEQVQETPSKEPRSTQDSQNSIVENDGPEDGSYRILKTGVHEQIRQLAVSPNGKLIAIATYHTVHLAILPDSSQLGQLPNRPIKLKASTVGRTTHIISQPPLASILWHPCGASGNCLVTVTTDAAVRLWEFDETNRWSSDTSTLAIDLRKLALGTTSEESFAPDRGRNWRFTADAAGMEVASACFGGLRTSDESSWSSLTLWVAMKSGDVYALCPVVPTKWQPCPTLIPTISAAVVDRIGALDDATSPGTRESRNVRDRYQWIQNLDGQAPARSSSMTESGKQDDIYRRPSSLPAIPRLQGPYQILADEDEDAEVCDIHVIAAKTSPEEPFQDEDSERHSEIDQDEGLSATVVVLSTRSGRCYVCLDPEGVEAEWLPRKEASTSETSPEPYLVVLEALDTMSAGDRSDVEWPLFTPDVGSRYSFFTTHSRGVFYFSLEPWLAGLEKEIQNVEAAGASFRFEILSNGLGTVRQRILTFDRQPDEAAPPTVPACIVLEDSDLGYFLITCHDGRPQSAKLDRPYTALFPALDTAEEDVDELNIASLSIAPARTPYQPSPIFYQNSNIPSFLEKAVPARHRHLTNQQVRLSPATLDLMTAAHRKLSRETNEQGVAAADLFRRCERLLEELEDQVSRVAECLDRTASLRESDGDRAVRSTQSQISVALASVPSKLRERYERAQDKQADLHDRFTALSRKVPRAAPRNKPLSDKEKAWAKEVEVTATALGIDAEDLDEDRSNHVDADVKARDGREADMEPGQQHGYSDEAQSGIGSGLRRRRDRIEELKDALIGTANSIIDSRALLNGDRDDAVEEDDGLGGISQKTRTEKVEEVMALLDRQANLLQSAQQRLERLNLVAAVE